MKFPREMKGTMKARVAVQNRENIPMINRRRWYRSQETFSRFLIMLLRREPGLEQCVLKQKFERKGEWLGKQLSCDDWHENKHFFAWTYQFWWLVWCLELYSTYSTIVWTTVIWTSKRPKKLRLRYSSWFELIIALVIRHNIYFFINFFLKKESKHLHQIIMRFLIFKKLEFIPSVNNLLLGFCCLALFFVWCLIFLN